MQRLSFNDLNGLTFKNFQEPLILSSVCTVSPFQVIPIVFCEHLVLEGSLKECKGDQGRVCDGSVTKELSNSKQVSKVVLS